MKCSSCGSENEEGSKFCTNCGATLPVPGEPASAPEQPTKPRRHRRRLILVVGILLAVLITTSLGVYVFVLRPLSVPGEETARLLPPDTQIYFSLNLRPGLGQLKDFRNILARYDREPDFGDNLDDLMQDIEEETGIDLEEDVFTWLGPEVAIAITEISEDPRGIMLLGTRDKEAAEAVLDDWLDRQEETTGSTFDTGSYRGFTIYSREPDYRGDLGEYYVVTNQYVLISNDEDLLEDTIDMMEKPRASLADEEAFQAARNAVPKKRALFLYANSEGIMDEIGRQVRGAEERSVFREVEKQMSSIIALSVSILDMGIRLDLYAENPPGARYVLQPTSVDLAKLLPDDTLALFSFHNVKHGWEEMRDALEVNREVSAEFEYEIEEFEDELGLNIERDILSWMTGELAVAFLPSRLRVGQYGDIQGAAEVVAVFAVEDRLRAEDTMDDLVRVFRREGGFDFDRETIGGVEATVMEPGYYPEGYTPGYLFFKDYLMIGTTARALADVMQTGRSLSEVSSYSQMVSKLPRDRSAVFYFDLEGLKELVLDLAGPSARSEYNRKMAGFFEPLNALVMAPSITEKATQFTLIVSLR